jgi:hypothetical protein
MANINLSTGIVVTTQIPLDGKTYFLTLADMLDLGSGDFKAFIYYDGMKSLCNEDKITYIWRERLPTEESLIGVLELDYVYPVGSISNEIDYSTRSFNFFEYYNPNPNLLEDKILEGTVFPTGPLSFSNTPIRYRINGIEYLAPVIILNLSVSDSVLNRTDVFAVDINGNLVVIEGVPAENAQEPNIVFGNQLRVAAVDINANDNNINNFNVDIIYDENLGSPNEWDTSVSINTGIETVAFDAIENPSNGAVHIDTNVITVANEIIFDRLTPFNITNLSSLAFELRTKARKEYSFNLKIFNGVDVVSSITVVTGEYGFDPLASEPAPYQTINIPASAFQFSDSTIDKIILTFFQSNASIFGNEIDYIRLLSGVQNAPSEGSYLDLTDTFDVNYANKAGYQPQVTNEENGLKLVLQTLHHIEDCLVRKIEGIDYNKIESKDEVYLKKVTDTNGNEVTLFGHTYDKDVVGNLDKLAFESYTQLQTIDI